jgi:hypothetical protein
MEPKNVRAALAHHCNKMCQARGIARPKRAAQLAVQGLRELG